MIVEAFYKGSNFKNLFDTFWNIKSIENDGANFILVTDKYMTKNDNIVLSTNEYELRITY